jgi:hypothetical protein
MRRLALVVLALLAGCLPAAAAERVRGVVHVHSELSTGEFSLEGLVGLADQQGIGALLLSENFLARVDYALPPFRALTRVSRGERDVAGDPAGYLARVAEVRTRLPHVVVIPGVEVIPHYYWTGSPLALDMTLHDVQKNVLVFGLDARQLAALPVIGNARGGGYTLQSLVDAMPVLLVIPGAALLARRRTVRQRIGRGAVVVVRRRPWALGLVLCAVGAAALVRGWPFTGNVVAAGEAGTAPYQALIDHVDAAGGITMWSLPEARDVGEQYVGPVHVSWLTEAYADDLLRTFRYTAFGAVYEDTSTFEQPGGGWDRLLAEYVKGERSRPAWALAESGFHGLTAGKQIGPIQTVFLARERSEGAILEALRTGRMYALQRTPQLGFDLAEFAATAGGATVGLGDTLRAPAGTPLEVRVAIDASDGGRHDVRVALIRNGRLALMELSATPYRAVYRETSDGTPLVLRVEARGAPPQRLLSNPIFVRP